MIESYVVLRKYDSCQDSEPVFYSTFYIQAKEWIIDQLEEERKLEEEANWDWIFELYRINKSDDLEFLETFSNT